MSRLYGWDDDSVTVATIPTTCGNCGERTDRVRLSLEIVSCGESDWLGIRTVAVTPCCNGKRSAPFPAAHLAKLLDHLQTCDNHHHGSVDP